MRRQRLLEFADLLHVEIILQQVLNFDWLSFDRLTGLVESTRYVLLRGNDCRTNEGILE
jgi:hypothetical protein